MDCFQNNYSVRNLANFGQKAVITEKNKAGCLFFFMDRQVRTTTFRPSSRHAVAGMRGPGRRGPRENIGPIQDAGFRYLLGPTPT